MNNIENDEMLKELAKHVDVDLNNLEPEDDYERKEIELAHEICGLPYDEIAHFLSRAEIPEFISPQWIFKALNCNDEFYIQNLALIRATEWMRQEVYAKAAQSAQVPQEKVAVVTEIAKAMMDSLKKQFKDISEAVNDEIEKVVNAFGDFLESSTPRLAYAVVQGATPDDVITKKNFFENYPDIEVQITSKSDTGNKEIKELVVLSSPELKKIKPFGIVVFSYDDAKDTVLYPLNRIPEAYTCDIEFKNGLRFYLVPKIEVNE